MACPTCDHTMENVVKGVFWCPRCGTILFGGGHNPPDYQVPRLVDRVQMLLDRLQDPKDSSCINSVHNLGIYESVNK